MVKLLMFKHDKYIDSIEKFFNDNGVQYVKRTYANMYRSDLEEIFKNCTDLSDVFGDYKKVEKDLGSLKTSELITWSLNHYQALTKIITIVDDKLIFGGDVKNYRAVPEIERKRKQWERLKAI